MDVGRKLREWEQEELLSQETAALIMEYEKQKHPDGKKDRMPLLMMVGLVFFTLAVFSFIAANWQVMPPLLKSGIVLSLMWLFYGLGMISEKRSSGWPVLYRMIGLAMFGASLIVTAQAFHLSSSGSILPWAVFTAALLHYALWRHAAYAGAAFIMGVVTLLASVPAVSWLEWGVFTAAALTWLVFSRKRLSLVFSWLLVFGSGLKLWSTPAVESLFWPVWTLFFLVFLLFVLTKEQRRMLLPLYPAVSAVSLLVYLAVRGETEGVLEGLGWLEAGLLAAAGTAVLTAGWWKFRPAVWTAVLGLTGLMMFDQSAVLLAVTAEAAALGYMFYAQKHELPAAPGFIYFILVQAVIYVVFAWGRLDMALFFLIGAFLLFAMAGSAWWFNQRKEAAQS
ncbi:DUF2157 domain-containing protein [Alkalicoccus urumqiensis]|uniref:DUF2157 domain-containing protein n=1 Tax=Alkalicoccus urumqiensis TaxID=1548213 RepID=A0A2P6MGW5_ALKUR|nr:DUF2157 domain-containing protein [Alkalicoccus urumqiensis]PRO65523.1 DUF2157 domain-containing protein [Alkalicoccus urumqiensis]